MPRSFGSCSFFWFSFCLAFSLALLLPPTVARAETLTRDQVTAALPALEAAARRAVDAGGVPGLAIAVVYNDETIYLKGFGLREVGKPETVDADTVFQLASLSKPVSSSVVAALVSEGIVGWSSRVADLDPAFALYDPYPSAQMTVRDLFNHRSGLPGSGGDDLEDIGYGRDEVLHRLRLVPPSSSFRAGYSYSNFGFTEGAIAAAKPTGKSWEAVVEEKLFGPPGMTSSSARYADFLARPNRSALHVKVDGAWAAKLKRDPDAQRPAGGINSSVRDLAQWMRLELGNGMFDGKRLMAAAALDETHVPLMARGNNPITGTASFYGLGWNVEFGRHGLSWGHAGAFAVGARTLVTIYPKSHLGIIVLSNTFPNGVPEGLADSFADLLFAGKVEKDSRHDLPVAPNPLDRHFVAPAPNCVWLADITYVETDQGWLYLATVMDLYGRRIVGWTMADHLRTELPLAALRMAIAAKQPGPGLIHHSDRGVQYASADYRKVIQSAGFQASMSRKADCYDNAPMESFFHTLKTELLHHQHYATRQEARREIFAYIEGFYNRTRRHSAIGYISPIEMELKAA